MPMAAGPASPADKAAPKAVSMQAPAMETAVKDAFAKDAIISWFRGEFAAANAIIDALCGHLAHVAGGEGSEYEPVFTAIHRRRLNWIPILQMQKYHSIADVAVELRKVAARKTGELEEIKAMKESCHEEPKACLEVEEEKVAEKAPGNDGNGGGEEVEDDSPASDITDSGSQELQPSVESVENIESVEICSIHKDCSSRNSQIKLTKGFSAKEQVKGHMVNVVKGLKLYEDIFTESELSKLIDFVNEIRVAGHNGELSGETFILFNKQVKGNRIELIQFGIPIFGHIKDEPIEDNQSSNNLEPIPPLLESVIDHLVQWQLIPEYKKPNGCIIHFFDEDEYSQPFLKPPHLDQPISTLILSESSMAYGRILVSDTDGNYKGPLMLSLKQGSLLVMRGNSGDMARHVMCPSPSKRVSITFFRVRPESIQSQSPPTTPQDDAMTLWQPFVPSPYPMPNGALNGYESMNEMSKWGILRAPVVMLTPVRPVMLNPKSLDRGGTGTGVFLPWTVGSRKPPKHLPPRAQKGRLFALSSANKTHVGKSISTLEVSGGLRLSSGSAGPEAKN